MCSATLISDKDVLFLPNVWGITANIVVRSLACASHIWSNEAMIHLLVSNHPSRAG